jgi:hypothetical protein
MHIYKHNSLTHSLSLSLSLSKTRCFYRFYHLGNITSTHISLLQCFRNDFVQHFTSYKFLRTVPVNSADTNSDEYAATEFMVEKFLHTKN